MATKKHSAAYYVLWLPIKYTGLAIGYGWYYLGRGFGWSLYHIGKTIGTGTTYLATKTKAAHVQRHITKAQPHTPPVYAPLTEVKNLHGSLSAFEHHLLSKPSTIGIILGARGSGKSAIGMKLLENMHAKTHRTVCAMGFKPETLPAWISSVQTVDAIPNNSVVLLDEAGITFSSRSSMSSANKLLSSLLLIARHKDLSVLFISQNCLPADEKIITPAGTKTLQQLKNGDAIYAYDFAKNRIVSAFSRKSSKITKKVIRIHLADGRILRSSADHRWIVSTKEGTIQAKRAKDIDPAHDSLIDTSAIKKGVYVLPKGSFSQQQNRLLHRMSSSRKNHHLLHER